MIWRGKYVSGAALAFAIVLSGCSGGGGSDAGGGSAPVGGSPPPPPPPPQKVSTELETPIEAARFMMQASFGASIEDLDNMVGSHADTWVANEMRKSRTDFLQPVLAAVAADADKQYRLTSDNAWKAMMLSEDTLRQRMVFALSQILVVSDREFGDGPIPVAYYQDILSRNAFGNYRDLLQEVTYSPTMARYLTYLRNQKGDPKTGRMPDENYARELLQLFTIGLVELNMDGTPKTNGQGEIETFDNDDIIGLARVFTGLSYKGEKFWDRDDDAQYQPLQMFEDRHSTLEKSFLGTTIPENTLGDTTISQALDAIFEHPNVAPFVSRQLIQRFTSSDPDPAYVRRVAQAFETGRFISPNNIEFGEGRRGDLSATIAAVLLDESVHRDPSETNNQAGKVREPVLKYVQWVHNFDVSSIDVTVSWRLGDTSSPADRLNQHPFRSASVFNFYRPGYIAPGTQGGAAGLTTPEYQVVNEGAALGYINFMTDFAFDRTNSGQADVEQFLPDYSSELALVNDPIALVDHLDVLMTAGQMSAEEKAAIADTVDALEITRESDEIKRVYIAVTMVASTPSYAVIR
jgi:uncharacterized protein (DUF1800 family)